MSLTIPLQTNLYNYIETVVLDGVSLDFWFVFNSRDGRWYWSVYETAQPYDDDGGRTPIIGGLPVSTNWPFFQQFKYDSRLPGGDIIPLDTSGQDLDPGMNDLGVSVVLVYITAAEIAAGPPT